MLQSRRDGSRITDANADRLRIARVAFESTIDASLKDPATRTAGLVGKLGTRVFAAHVASLIR